MKNLTRREYLRLLGGSTAALMMSRLDLDAISPVTLPSLRNLAAARGIKFGSDADNDMSATATEFAELFANQCALLAPILSWANVSPEPDVHEYSRARENLNFAQAHNLLLTGAHLLWHERTPKWFETIQDRKLAEQAVRRHIRTMLEHFSGQVWSWNVVNEAIKVQSPSDYLRASPLLSNLGPDFISQAFAWTREADASVLLVYNDYGFEDESRGALAKRQALLRLLDSMAKQKAPIDAVGLQSHLSTGIKFNESGYRAFLRDIAACGLKIVISELDVKDMNAPADIAQRDQAVADTYAKFLNVALDEPNVTGLVVWGLSDRYSWYNDPHRPYTRKNKLPGRPLLFDEKFQPKLAFDAVVKALQTAPEGNESFCHHHETTPRFTADNSCPPASDTRSHSRRRII